MIINTILFKDENMEVKETYSSAGDYVLRMRAEKDAEVTLGDTKIALTGKITKAFNSSTGKELAKAFPNSVVNKKVEAPVAAPKVEEKIIDAPEAEDINVDQVLTEYNNSTDTPVDEKDVVADQFEEAASDDSFTE